MISNPISVAYFGGYDPNYSRVHMTLESLRRNNIKVYECRSRANSIITRLFSLTKQYAKIFKKIDVLMVCEAGHTYVPLAKILALITRKPLAFDAFISKYQVDVIERKKALPGSLKGKYFYFLDKLSCSLADLVFMDTSEHVDYICELINLKKEKFSYFLIGADDNLFYPMENRKKTGAIPQILFVGSFIPLHGVEYIIKAAHILEKENFNAMFKMVGEGMMREKAERLVRKLNIKNVEFFDNVPYEKIPEIISESDINLGQFSASKQVQIVIPIKVYESMAMRKPVITGYSKAIERIFKHKKSIYFCEIENEFLLAESIKDLITNEALRNKIADNGYKIVKNKMTPMVIGEKIKNDLTKLVRS